MAESNPELVKPIINLPHLHINALNRKGLSAFHMAVLMGNVEVMAAFIKVNRLDSPLALHWAVRAGNIEVFRFLLSKKIFDVNSQDEHGKCPLHIAIIGGYFDIVKVIICTKQCNLSLPDEDGNTPLHLVCLLEDKRQEAVKIAKLLLHSGKVNPQCVNCDGKTPAELVKDNYGILQELSTFLEVTTRNPLENFMKILVVGKAEVGKSSLIEAICTEAKYSFWRKKRLVKNISCQTLGIVSRTFCSKHFGHAIFYEFAGQLGHHSSNAAILENLIRSSPPVFVVVVSLKNSDASILSDISYWWNFISTPCEKSVGDSLPHVIIALSYLDKFKQQGRHIEPLKEFLLEQLHYKFPQTNFEFDQKISALDCRKLVSNGLTCLQSFLNESCGILRVDFDVDFRCHYLIAFLRENFKDDLAIQLTDIQSRIQADNFMHKDSEELVKLLDTLHKHDKILLLKNSMCEESWIVLQKETLLSEVNGSIFSRTNFQKHLAYSTGVVPLTNIKRYFDKYDPNMLIDFFSHLEFCSLIEDPKAYNLIQNEYPSLVNEKYCFFPGLIRDTCPAQEEVWRMPASDEHLKYGWYYEADKFELLPRFLHVLILRIAFKFALKGLTNVESPVINRRCSVWINGIAWLKDGFHIVVEVGLQKNWVSVIIQCKDSADIRIECSRILLNLILTIQETRMEFCSSLNMTEYFIMPECVGYPMEPKVSDDKSSIVYGVEDAIQSVLSSSTGFVTDKSGRHSVQLSHLVPFEPLLYCGQTLISDILCPVPEQPCANSNEKFLELIKSDIVNYSKSHPQQIELIESFILHCRRSGFCSESHSHVTVSHCFSQFVIKCSILSHKLSHCVSIIITIVTM